MHAIADAYVHFQAVFLFLLGNLLVQHKGADVSVFGV
jgi:hypothetical protein